jgi:hypothetical protein
MNFSRNKRSLGKGLQKMTRNPRESQHDFREASTAQHGSQPVSSLNQLSYADRKEILLEELRGYPKILKF